MGALQDKLRAQGLHVIGGSAFGDRLENDRAFAQSLLGAIGLRTADVREFANAPEAIADLAAKPRRTVLKFSGPDHASGDNYIGQAADGTDVIALLRSKTAVIGDDARFILMDYIDGIEVGVGAYFDGTRFLRPACMDWEHKRFFAGDMGELTGEMGTVATFGGTDAFFEASLLKLEPLLTGRGHVGYVNLNTIVNDDGIWPLELTCRFGYPGFAVLAPLQRTSWSALFRRMLIPDGARFETNPGFSTGIVLTTPPFPYSRKQIDEPVGLPIMFDPSLDDDDRRHLHLGEAGLSNGQFVTAGLYGWTMVVTGTGPTVEKSRAEACRRIAKITVPNGRYRLDIGERTAAQVAQLGGMGLFNNAGR